MTNDPQFETEGLDETWAMMKTFLKENIERRVKSGWTEEEAREHSLGLLEGLMGSELTEEGKASLFSD